MILIFMVPSAKKPLISCRPLLGVTLALKVIEPVFVSCFFSCSSMGRDFVQFAAMQYFPDFLGNKD